MQREIYLVLKNKKLKNYLKRIKKSNSPICVFQLQKNWFKCNNAFSVLFNINKKRDVFLIPNLVKTLKEIVLQKTLESRTGSACSQCVFVTKNGGKLRFKCWSIPLQFQSGKGIQCLFSELKSQDLKKQTELDQLTVSVSQPEETISQSSGGFFFSTEDTQSSSDLQNSVNDELIEKNVVFGGINNKEKNFQTSNLSEREEKKNLPKYISYEVAVQKLSQNNPNNSYNEIMKENASENNFKSNGSENNPKISSDLNQLSPKNELNKKINESFNKKNKNKKIRLKTIQKADKHTEKNRKKNLNNTSDEYYDVDNIHLNNNPKNQKNQENSRTKDEEDVDSDFLQSNQTNQQINFETMTINNFFNFCIKYINTYNNQMKSNYQPKKEIFSDLQKVNSIFIKFFSKKIEHIKNLNKQLSIEEKTSIDNLKKLDTHYQKRFKEFQTKQQNSKTNQILQNQIVIFKQIIEKLLKNGTDIQQIVTDLD
ncbi:hypothetical protein M0813_07235 [Anaeramoeba flamelloides]|uniref:Uncharacterized protein n=1 Tax=Anaeramoeba flamelloides TaxID=1746091 RepID=A0ABQ8XD30_9EUKA|nr:hypothetical protein M0813_07235 [Anaeramoeba flamelloides]